VALEEDELKNAFKRIKSGLMKLKTLENDQL
jgi:hypothetical protein